MKPESLFGGLKARKREALAGTAAIILAGTIAVNERDTFADEKQENIDHVYSLTLDEEELLDSFKKQQSFYPLMIGPLLPPQESYMLAEHEHQVYEQLMYEEEQVRIKAEEEARIAEEARKAEEERKAEEARVAQQRQNQQAQAASGSGQNTIYGNTVWDALATCESTNNWAINTGNGYYGGLQMNMDFWRSYGGFEFAQRPDLATREQQIIVAIRARDSGRGYGPWPACSAKLGLR